MATGDQEGGGGQLEPCSLKEKVKEAEEIEKGWMVVLERTVVSILDGCNLFSGNLKKC